MKEIRVIPFLYEGRPFRTLLRLNHWHYRCGWVTMSLAVLCLSSLRRWWQEHTKIASASPPPGNTQDQWCTSCKQATGTNFVFIKLGPAVIAMPNISISCLSLFRLDPLPLYKLSNRSDILFLYLPCEIIYLHCIEYPKCFSTSSPWSPFWSLLLSQSQNQPLTWWPRCH